MIFAGDFAQLEPPGSGYSLFSSKVTSTRDTAGSWQQQEASLGKATWHQVTTVVILWQNMRRKSQTPEDAKIRRISGTKHAPWQMPHLYDPNFHNVSMILSYIEVARFAKDTGQTLHTFYSSDHFASTDDTGKRGKAKKNTEVKHKMDKIHPHLQEQLWALPHKDTNNHPGKLSLCVGPPVMIKANEATECNVTNGAEAVVVVL
ncbi:hypothetical protein FOMPIDRAFT_65514 [Fomitopsis schrenkii]|uniref:DNA helicase n=1 Tax=Fomitopsis schrenkii TaxID=2126942 RepID=S8F4W3_FOMSC|nr:hypothetical protein FOMPIDRAFT_65514 [Fomitopsis schrenkii]